MNRYDSRTLGFKEVYSYQDALLIVDQLESMSRKSYIRNIRSLLIRLIIHLIKNQVEQRLTNSWVASIEGSILEIQDLNLEDNKTSYYVKSGEWEVGCGF
ncbi:hypothetical protein NSTC745_04345 [Nostoc sp. DSM 114161]|jgi:hypothetical protein